MNDQRRDGQPVLLSAGSALCEPLLAHAVEKIFCGL